MNQPCENPLMNGGFTLSQEQVQGWADDLRRNAEEIARLHAERAAILDKVHAARKLFGAAAFPDMPLEAVDLVSKQAPQTIISFVEEQIERAEAGIALTELAGALKESPLRERFLNSPNAIYTAVGRLIDKGKAFRVGRIVYSRAAHERLGAGESVDRNAKESQQTLQSIILAVLTESQKGLTSGEILDEVRRRDEAQAARLSVRPQLGYNAIARLLGKGRLRRDGKFYRLPGVQVVARQSPAQLAFD